MKEAWIFKEAKNWMIIHMKAKAINAPKKIHAPGLNKNLLKNLLLCTLMIIKDKNKF